MRLSVAGHIEFYATDSEFACDKRPTQGLDPLRERLETNWNAQSFQGNQGNASCFAQARTQARC